MLSCLPAAVDGHGKRRLGVVDGDVELPLLSLVCRGFLALPLVAGYRPTDLLGGRTDVQHDHGAGGGNDSYGASYISFFAMHK